MDATGIGATDSTYDADERGIVDVALKSLLQNGSQNGYANFLTAGADNASGVILSQLASESSGVIRVTGNDADNDESILQYGTAGCVKINKAANDPKVLAFEARFRKPDVGDNEVGMFLGLASEALNSAAAILTDDDAAMADIDHIGFHVDQADGDALDFVYTKAGQTDTIQIAGVQALSTTDTWYKVGFLLNPGAPPANRIRIFVDNVEQSTYVTETEVAASDFPEDEEMTLTWATKTGAAAAKQVDLDWWAVGQAH